jgi:hypothetical protein
METLLHTILALAGLALLVASVAGLETLLKPHRRYTRPVPPPSDPRAGQGPLP